MKSALIIPLFLVAYLCAIPAPAQSRIDYTNPEFWDEWRLQTNDGVQLFVREFGQGDTITVLHGGWGAEHSYLIRLFAPLAHRFHFIFYDQRGSLRSRCPDSLISVQNHIDDVERIRRATNQEKLLLVGHSMGGFLAMSYLANHPDKVRGLVMISSAPARGNIQQLTEGLAPALQRWKRQEVTDTLQAYGLSNEIQKNYSPIQRGLWHRITFSALNLHHVKNWRKLQSAFYYESASSTMAATTGPQEWDFTGVLRQASFPITVIHGDDDYLPLAYQQAWIGQVSNVELVVIQDAGHLCWIDRPDETERRIEEAIEKY